MGHSHAHGEDKPLGIVDAIGGTVVFLLLCWGLYSLLAVAVPGMLKFETALEIVRSGILFLLVWGLVGNRVFKAYFDVLEEREAKTKGAMESAQALRKNISEIDEEIAGELRSARFEGLKDRDALIEEANQEASKLKKSAEEKAEGELKVAARELDQVKEEASIDLGLEAESLAQLVKEKALSSENSRVIH